MKIGTILKEEREKRGLTLEDVSKETLIRLYYLEKIENDDFGSEFDGYILSYIRMYAEFLNIDSLPLISEYKSLFVKSEKHAKHKAFPISKFFAIPFLIFFALLIVVFLLKSFIIKNSQLPPKQDISTNISSEVPPSVSEETPSNTTPKEENNVVEETPKEAPVVVVLTASGRCWLGINQDGKTTQKFINNGETLKLTAQNYIQIRFGNAKVVKINYNGKDLGVASSTKTVIDYKFTKEKAQFLGSQ
ncbi:MAG: DUF4115 domain-containing protein [Caldisericaceae bacterium]